MNGESTTNVLFGVFETRVLPSRLEEQSKYLASLPFPKKGIVTRQSASNWHQAQGETTLALCISFWHSDGSVSCNNFTVSPRLGDSRNCGEQYLWHCEKLILCTCKIVHLGNIKLKKLDLSQNINAQIRNATEMAVNEQNEMVDLCNPDSLFLKFMHSSLLPSTPSKPCTHHALIPIHIDIDIDTERERECIQSTLPSTRQI